MKSRKRKPAKKGKSHKNQAAKRTKRQRKFKTPTVKRGRSPRPRPNKVPLNAREAAVQQRVFRALGRMRRDGESASRAARQEGLKLETFIRYARRALRRSGPGKPWKAVPEDQLAAVMNILTKFGYVPDLVRISRERRLLWRYNVAVQMFRAGQDGAEAALNSFRGKKVAGHTLITDIKLLTQLEEAGKLDFDNLYSFLGAGS